MITMAPATAARTATLAEQLLLAYVFVVPFGSAISLPTPAPVDDLSSVLGALAGLALLVRLAIQPAARRLDLVAAHLWVLLLGVMALSWFWSIAPRSSFDELIVHGSLIGQAMLAAVQYYSSYFHERLLPALAGSAVVTGLIALGQMATGNLGQSGTSSSRFALVGGDPNITAAALLLPLGAALTLAQRPRNDGAGVRNVAHAQPRYLIAAGLAIFAIVLTLSRGGLLGIGVVLAAAVLRRRGVGAWFMTFAGLIAAVPFLPASDRGTQSTGRTSIWRIGIESCNERCWFGAGNGAFPDVHEALALAKPELAANQFRYEAHNIFIGGLVELGFVGAFLLIMIFALALASSFRAPDRIGWAAFAGTAGVLLANLLVSNLGFKYVWLALVVAAIAGSRPLDDTHPLGVRP